MYVKVPKDQVSKVGKILLISSHTSLQQEKKTKEI